MRQAEVGQSRNCSIREANLGVGSVSPPPQIAQNVANQRSQPERIIRSQSISSQGMIKSQALEWSRFHWLWYQKIVDSDLQTTRFTCRARYDQVREILCIIRGRTYSQP